MDVQRKDVGKRRMRCRIIVITSFIGVAALVGVLLSRLEVPAYRVEESSVWVETVKCGELLREVSGIGTLVPESNRLITANSSGVVEELLLYPGSEVDIDTVIMVMSNPTLVLEAENARFDLAAAEANFARMKIELKGALLQMEAKLTQLKANHEQAQLRANLNEKLFADGLVAELSYCQSKLDVKQFEERVNLEERRFAFQANSNVSQVEAGEVGLKSARGRFELLENQVEALQVKAGVEGVLQRLLVEAGQQVGPGTTLAQAADPNRLKAVIQISETQAKDISIGQKAIIDTRNGIVVGRVTRVDPSVVQGTVAVDVALVEELPKGARPDLTVQGNIELENMSDVIFVARPAFAREHSTMGIYRIDAEGVYAIRTSIQFGRSSVSSIEIIDGLSPGDRIIVSDTYQFEEHDRILIQ